MKTHRIRNIAFTLVLAMVMLLSCAFTVVMAENDSPYLPKKMTVRIGQRVTMEIKNMPQ